MEENKGAAGSLNFPKESASDSLGLTSETFDPMRVIYANSFDNVHEDVDVFDSVSQFLKDVQQTPQTETREARNMGLKSPAVSSRPHNTNTVLLSSEKEPVGKMFVDSTGKTKEESLTSDPVQKVTHSHRPNQKAEEIREAKRNEAISPEEPEKSTQSTLTRIRRKERKTVLTQMQFGFQEGPLSILRRSVEERLKVRVWTRSARNVRGICTGFVIAFDKHMNLAMSDVDEVYRKPVGKHQKKSKKPVVKPVHQTDVSQERETCYPNIPWQCTDTSSGSTTHTSEAALAGTLHSHMESDSDRFVGDDDNCPTPSVPADGIGDLTSAFSGMHMFEENKATRLLGVKSRKLLTRHLNQVLLRGEHVVAVALVELDL